MHSNYLIVHTLWQVLIFAFSLLLKTILRHTIQYNIGKNCIYVVDLETDKKSAIPLFLEVPQDILCYGVSQYDEGLSYTVNLIVGNGIY